MAIHHPNCNNALRDNFYPKCPVLLSEQVTLKNIWSLAKYREKKLLTAISHEKTLWNEQMKRSSKMVRILYQSSGSMNICLNISGRII